MDSRCPPDDHWLATLERHQLKQLLGPRIFGQVLASHFRYVQAPTLVAAEQRVAATITDDTAALSEQFEVSVHVTDEVVASGRCSRCSAPSGLCVHAGVLVADLACSRPLRDGLLHGRAISDLAEAAPLTRRALHLELQFDRALSTWVSHATAPIELELAATPLSAGEAPTGRAYGEHRTASASNVLSLAVRRRGERKLLTGREIVALLAASGQLDPRDRRVLEHVRERGSSQKQVTLTEVDASLAIEAMSTHRRVFAAGFQGYLRFRPGAVRPTVQMLERTPDVPRGFHSLGASWRTEDGQVSFPFADGLLFGGPFPYVWTKSGALFRVASDVDLHVVGQLASAPVLTVPAGKLRDTGAKLIQAARGRGIDLPPRETFGLPPAEQPRLVLRLDGEPLALRGTLMAVYGQHRNVLVYEQSTAFEEHRNVEAERQAWELLDRCGLLLRDDEDEVLAFDAARIEASGDRAVAFWREGLPMLRASQRPHLDVELTARLANVRVGAPLQGHVHVALEEGWLKTRLEFAAEELAVELNVVRAALARKQHWVELSDGTLSKISEALEALVTSADQHMGAQAEALLPLHQLGRLERWLEEHDGRVDLAVSTLRKRLRALSVAAEPDMPRGLTGTLRPYQRLGLAWLQFLETLGAGGIFADDMGLGKTITTLAFLMSQRERLGPAPSLVVCPTSVATNWVQEAARFTPSLRLILQHGPARDWAAAAQHDVVVTTYAILRNDLESLSTISWRCVVLDEAQNIKNHESATARAANQLKTSMRLSLSGTPMENRLLELWSLASFANPGILGSQRTFELRYERPLLTEPSTAVGAELRSVLRPFVLRRTKEDVLGELPPKTEIDRVVTMSRTDKRMYDALARTLRVGLKKDLNLRRIAATSLDVFTAITRLRQMACDPRLIDHELGSAPSAKREAFLDLVRELVAEGRRALVFSQFVQLLTLWRRDLDAEHIGYEYLDGSTTNRAAVVERFQNGKMPLFLISLKAGGVGLNLTAADTVIHCDPWWNPAVEDQATDRAHRIGQTRPVTVVRLITRGTIEEKILALKSKKRELATAVVGDEAGALEGITEDDLRMLLGDSETDSTAEADDDAPPDEMLASATEVFDPDYLALVRQAQQWISHGRRFEHELATLIDVPPVFVARLLSGQPFPCSRTLAEQIRVRLSAW